MVYPLTTLQNNLINRFLTILMIIVNFTASMVYSMRHACDNAKQRHIMRIGNKRNTKLVLPIHQSRQMYQKCESNQYETRIRIIE